MGDRSIPNKPLVLTPKGMQTWFAQRERCAGTTVALNVRFEAFRHSLLSGAREVRNGSKADDVGNLRISRESIEAVFIALANIPLRSSGLFASSILRTYMLAHSASPESACAPP
jgi:hypothetical protein